MTVVIKSSTDSDETVKAALGDLVPPKPEDDKKPIEEKSTDPVEPKEEPTEPVDPAEPQEEELKEETEEELEAKTDDEEPKPPKKKGGFQKKIVKLEQEKEYWRQEALRAQNHVKPAEPVKPIVDTSTRPKATDFATHDEYLESLVEWKADQKIAAINLKRQQEETKSKFDSKLNAHYERVNSFKESHEDFDDKWNELGNQSTLAINEAILDSEHGAEIMYALADDPEEFQRIRKLPYGQAMKAMGAFESKLIKPASTPPETKTTRAPKPVTPVRTRGAAAVKDINDPNISYEDYKRLRNEQIKQNSMRR